MKPQILVLYYTQTGQLRDILNSVTADIRQDAELTFAAIEPEVSFPFPWNSYSFFNAMPETVARIPIAVKPLPAAVLEKKYDLIILGYQPWFLNPSQPITGFLFSKQAEQLFEGTPVISVVGSRNMWLNAQERVKEDLLRLKAKLVGNIVMEDTHGNIVSLLTVIRWAFKGQKEKSRFLPEAGVQQSDIIAASRFGKPILEAVKSEDYHQLQPALLQAGAVRLVPGLIILEKRGIKNFRVFAKWIREKGGPDAPGRKARVKTFQRLLLSLAFLLSPVSSLTAFIQKQVKRRQLKEEVNYFKSLDFVDKKI